MTAPERRLTLGKRLYRAFFFAILVGVVGTGMAVIPALFVQSAFTGSLQYCHDLQQQDMAQYGEVRTTCADDLKEEPTWLPAALMVGGALVGVLGGFGYGFISPESGARRNGEAERPWLPF